MKWLRRWLELLPHPELPTRPPSGTDAQRARREAEVKLRQAKGQQREAHQAMDAFTRAMEQAMRGQRP